MSRDARGRFLPGHDPGNTLATPEARARHAASVKAIPAPHVASQRGRAGRLASPWNRGPMVDSPNAKLSFMRNARKAKP